MIARLVFVMGLIEMSTLEKCIYPCGPDTDPFQIKCDPADAVDMAGPRGKEPFIQWATPRLPIGATAIEVRGRQFGTDATKLKLEVTANGAVATAKELKLQGAEPDMVLTAQLTWTGGAMPGAAQVVLTSSEGASNGQSVLLIKPAFQPVAQMGTLPDPASSVYLGTGAGATQQALYAVTSGANSALVSILYDAGSGALTMPTPLNGSVIAAAPAFLNLPRPTEFFALGKSYEPLSCTPSGATYSCSGSIDYGRPWMMSKATVVGSGTTDKNRELMAVAAEDQSIYRCFYDRAKTPKEQPCAKIPAYMDNAKKLWVGQLGTGRADILALSATGTLTLLRDGTGTDVFTDQTSVLPQAAGTAWQAVVVDDVDGVSGKDIVAVGPSGVTTWLNKSDGTFAAPTTDPVGINARELILGDVDNDNKPDLILLPQSGDGLQILLNLSGTSPGNGRFSAPAAALDLLAGKAITGVTGSLVTVDGGAGGAKRRLIILSGTTVTAWDNKVLP